jgi:hypothetical protein
MIRPCLIGLLIALFHWPSSVPQGGASAPTPSAADSSWRSVYLPKEYQFTSGGGVIAVRNGAYIAGYFHRGFFSDGPDPYWGGKRLELRGEVNLFLALHGADGLPRWARRYGDAGRIAASGIAQGPDGSLFVAGTMAPAIANPGDAQWTIGARTLTVSKPSAFLARFDTAGNAQWVQIIDGVTDVNEVVVDSGGRIYVGGDTGGDTGEPPGIAEGHAYLASYTADGKRSWFRTVSGGRSSAVGGIAVTPYGVCVAGRATTVGGPGKPPSEQLAPSGSGFVAGYNRTGTRLWHHEVSASYPKGEPRRRYSSDSPQSISVILYAAAADGTGACYAGGGFAGVVEFGSDNLVSEGSTGNHYTPYGLTDALILKYDKRGTPKWARRGIGGPNSDYVQAIATTPNGRIIVAGDFMGMGNFGKFSLALPSPEPRVSLGVLTGPPRGIFVATLSSEGEILRAFQNVPEISARPTGMSVTKDGNVYITGTQEQSAVYGRISAPTQGINAFLARLSGL